MSDAKSVNAEAPADHAVKFEAKGAGRACQHELHLTTWLAWRARGHCGVLMALQVSYADVDDFGDG
jgi:hypothetical protein